VHVEVVPREGRKSVEHLIPLEAERARELAAAGIIRRLWRVPGRWENWGLWEAADADELHEAISSLPLFPHLSVHVQALASHPSDPGGKKLKS
jgi:muconolactone delta-isomerase